jgi:Uma2 family endonuclease
MQMATSTKSWTRADLDRFPEDGIRYEVLDGDLLVTPLPAGIHLRLAPRLTVLISVYCQHHRIGFVTAPGAVPYGDSELQPDIAAVLDPTLPIDAPTADFPLPSLVIEILSPSTKHRDRGVKRDAYLRWGIPEYWIVDPETRDVTIVRPSRDDERVVDTLRWQPQPDLPALEIKLAELFA